MREKVKGWGDHGLSRGEAAVEGREIRVRAAQHVSHSNPTHSGPQWPKRAPGSINVTHWPLSLSFRKCKKCHLIKTSFLMPCLREMVSFSDEMCLIARYCISFHLSAIFKRWSVFYGFQACIFMAHNQGGGLVVPDCQIIQSAHHSEQKRKTPFCQKLLRPYDWNQAKKCLKWRW